jgi:hypothetical protein
MLEEVKEGQILYRTKPLNGEVREYVVLSIDAVDFQTGEQQIVLAGLPGYSPKILTTNLKLKEGGYERELNG